MCVVVKVFIRGDDKCFFVAIDEIRLLASEGNYTRVHAVKHKPLIYRSLNALEERLPEELFFRANRSTIINLKQIEDIEDCLSGNLKVRLNGGAEVDISRRQAALFRQRASL